MKPTVTTTLRVLAAAVCAIAGLRGASPGKSETSRATVRALDVDAILWAIRQVESGDRPGAIGRAGERSAYQFMPAVWRALTSAPFEIGTQNPRLADRVARAHLAAVRRDLERRGLEELPEFIAAAWRCGPRFTVLDARAEPSQRVAALYWDRIEGRMRP